MSKIIENLEAEIEKAHAEGNQAKADLLADAAQEIANLRRELGWYKRNA